MIDSYNFILIKIEIFFNQKSLCREFSESPAMPFEAKAFHSYIVQVLFIHGSIIFNIISCSINHDILFSCKMYYISNIS